MATKRLSTCSSPFRLTSTQDYVLFDHFLSGVGRENHSFGCDVWLLPTLARQFGNLQVDGKLISQLRKILGTDGHVHPQVAFFLAAINIGRQSPHPPWQLIGKDDSLIRRRGSRLEYFDRFIQKYKEISRVWLRDNCTCPECHNQETGQRRINVFKHNFDYDIAKIEETPSAYEVTCEDYYKDYYPLFELIDRLVIVDDGHKATFTKDFLRSRSSTLNIQINRSGQVPAQHWDAGIAKEPPTVHSNERGGVSLEDLLRKIRTHGFCFVEGIEATPEATEKLLESIGPITNTHYGGFYDFTSDLSSKDTAYTSEALEPHNDNSYFTAAAGLQALHLLSHTNGSGGESSLVDGFAIAAQLWEQDYNAYAELSRTEVYAHASGNEGISIQPAQGRPVLSHSRHTKSLMQITWNNADRAGLSCGYRHLDNWYNAAEKFDALVNDPKNQYWFQLKPGTLLIFDNWRVLHGRAAFTGKRRMCGGYIARDDFISKFKATNMTPEDIKASTVTG